MESEGYVTYSDNNKRRIHGHGDIVGNASVIIQNVLYVEGLKYSFVSISQMCNKRSQDHF